MIKENYSADVIDTAVIYDFEKQPLPFSKLFVWRHLANKYHKRHDVQ